MAGENDKKTSRKLFFSMGEVAELFDVKPSLLRFWEKRFDILRPRKNAKGNRLFTPQDIENLKLIHHLVKEKGMTLSGAQKYLRDNKNTLQRDVQLVERLQHVRAMLLEIKGELGAESSGTQIVIKPTAETPIEPSAELSIEPSVEPSVEVRPAETSVSEVFTEVKSTETPPAEIPQVVPVVPQKPARKQQTDSPPRYIEQTLFDF